MIYRKKTVIIFIIIFIAILVVLLVPRENLKNPVSKPETKGEAVEADDYTKMYRKAQKQDRGILKKALEMSNSKSPRKREQAANLLGQYDTSESLSTLEGLLKDENELVKIKAIYAISNKKNKKRENILIRYINNESFNDLEKVHLYSSLHQSTSEQDRKSLAIDHLVYVLKNTNNQKAKQIAVAKLSQLPEANKKVDQAFQQLLYSDNPSIVANAIRYFSFTKNQWYKDVLNNFYTDTSLSNEAKIALIETMHIICPPKRYEYMKNFLSSQNKDVQKAMIKQSLYHNAEKARSLILEKIDSFDSENQAIATRYVDKLEKTDRVDRCN